MQLHRVIQHRFSDSRRSHPGTIRFSHRAPHLFIFTGLYCLPQRESVVTIVAEGTGKESLSSRLASAIRAGPPKIVSGTRDRIQSAKTLHQLLSTV